MTPELVSSFLTYYIQSLRERTREEKSGTKFGFDWIIYNIGLSKGWTPYRLPFVRSGNGETAKTKTEAEFGIDLAFLSEDRKALRIFVLKDEMLNNKNFTANDFDTDLRNASAPDLAVPELHDVTSVEVILAYNKDEDAAGVALFDRRVQAQGTRVGDDVSLRFERWNLTRIVEEVQATLLTPALLPQKYFSQFSYVCLQFADFAHGSEEWEGQLVPNWRNFLQGLLSEKADERCVRLLPVALIILLQHGRENPTLETGWIDLVEWGLLAAWEAARLSSQEQIKSAVAEMWVGLYLAELERYYREHAAKLAIHHSLHQVGAGGFVDAVVAAVIAHWHLARLGILSAGMSDLFPDESGKQQDAAFEVLNEIANWIASFLSVNPAALRPLLDIHHVQLWLVWAALLRVGRIEDVHTWLTMLASRLSVRRVGAVEIPFLEGHNSLDLVFETVATGSKPPEFCDGSSLFLTCMLEIVCCMPADLRNPLLEEVVRRLVSARDDDGAQLTSCTPIDLMLWFPPEGIGDIVLTKSLADEGECTMVNLENFGESSVDSGDEIFRRLSAFVRESRAKRAFAYPKWLPTSVFALACIKFGSPLPPEVWRGSIFRSISDAKPSAETSSEVS